VNAFSEFLHDQGQARTRQADQNAFPVRQVTPTFLTRGCASVDDRSVPISLQKYFCNKICQFLSQASAAKKAPKVALLDHLIGAGKQRGRDG